MFKNPRLLSSKGERHGLENGSAVPPEAGLYIGEAGGRTVTPAKRLGCRLAV